MNAPVRVLVLLSKRQPPSSRLRFRGCHEEFSRQGLEMSYQPIPSGPVARLKTLFMARNFDAVIIQKKTSFRGVELRLLKSLNSHIILDFDDAVMFHELEHRQPLTGKNFYKFLRTIGYCDAVVAGNRFLADFARPNLQQVFILPTPIDTDAYQVKNCRETNDGVVIGWVGVSGNLRYVQEIAPALRRVATQYPATVLKIISNASLKTDSIPVHFKPWRLEDELADLQSVDIGIMPLDDSLWARGKCGYKILQFMGVGVPVVASPVGINIEFIKPGVNGYLADTLDSWAECLAGLIEDRDLRMRMGQAGRNTVNEKYSVKKYAQEYAQIIRRVVGRKAPREIAACPSAGR